MKNIKLNQKVTYQKDRRQHTGVVTSLKRDICNGQPYAVIEVDHELAGVIHKVPLCDINTANQT